MGFTNKMNIKEPISSKSYECHVWESSEACDQHQET